nr:hypothetical protein [Kouleothrix sp.]
EPTFKDLETRYGKDIRLAWRNQPLSFHPNAKPAAPARKPIPRLFKVIGGAIFMMIVTGLLASTTHNYIPAVIFGAVFGAIMGLMLGSWPPGPGDEVTGGE